MGTQRIPVIIGIGELTDKQSTPDLEPVELLLRATQQADTDAGGGWARRIDSLRIVRVMSWDYRDLPALLAKKLRLKQYEGIHGPVGGETPGKLLVDAAADIAAGHSEVALVCGAEATKTLMASMMRGIKPAWSDPDPDAKRMDAEDFTTPLCARYGLAMPTDVYPLYENATRAAWGQSFDEAQTESGTIWSNMANAAAQNPHAWSGKPMSAQDIATPSESNRYIAFPYTKFQVAQIGVNQSSAVLLTHRDAALAAGIPEEKLVYVWAGANAHEPHDVLARANYTQAPALEHVLKRTLALNGVSTPDIGLFELYSCFPVVPKLARRALGLPADAALSIAGGLTFFGGPTNNYMGHAITAAVRALRDKRGHKALLHGNGEFVTKHHAVVLADTPPPASVLIGNTDLQAEVDADGHAVPALLEQYEGPCTLETFTVSFTPKGKPDRGTVIARTATGERVIGRVTEAEPETLAFLIDPTKEVIGTQGHMYDGGDGLSHFALQVPVVKPEPQVLFEKLTPHIALVTLNRPDKRNIVNGAVTRLMVKYVRQIENDPDVRVAILAASGDKAFCAGADLSEAAAGHGQDLTAGGNGFAGFVNAKRRKPWVAAVRGFALGGGTELALACDLVVASETANFGLPEVKRGLIAAAGGLYRLARALPQRKAMELALTGDTIDAAQALELHLVNQVVADAELMPTAQAMAERIAANAPVAVVESRVLVSQATDFSDEKLAGLSVDAIVRLMATEDFQEGQRAFLEKRAPNWKGR
ncbi:MAG: enoyl-CoA hydratase-related protein [Pseudoxanthomonas sp.]